MNCPTHEELSLFHDGELPARRVREVRRHVRDCPQCSAWVRNLQRLDAAASGRAPTPECLTAEELAELVDGVAGEELEARAQAHAASCGHCKEAWSGLMAAKASVAGEVAPVRRTVARRAVAWTAVAAAAAALIAVAFWPRPGPPPPEQRAPQMVEAPRAPGGAVENALPSPGETPEEPERRAVAAAPVGPPAPQQQLRPARRPQPRHRTPARAPAGEPEQERPPAESRPATPTPPSTPEPPALALVGGSALAQRWAEAKGDTSGFSLEELKELRQELPRDRAVLKALVKRLEASAAADPAAEMEMERYKQDLEALEIAPEEQAAPRESAAPQTEEAGVEEGAAPAPDEEQPGGGGAGPEAVSAEEGPPEEGVSEQ